MTFSVQCQAASTIETQIRSIRSDYAATNADLARARKIAWSDETGDTGIESYFVGKELKKVVLSGYAGENSTRHEYYFRHGQLFFVFRQHETEGKHSNVQHRFYFHNGRLLRWLDANKKPVAPSSVRFRRCEIQLKDAQRFWLRYAAMPRRIGQEGAKSHLGQVLLKTD